MQFSCDCKSQIETEGTCEQGVGSQTLSRASLIIMHLLSAGVCLSSIDRKSESVAFKCLQLANRYYMQSVKHSSVQTLSSEVSLMLSRGEWESCK